MQAKLLSKRNRIKTHTKNSGSKQTSKDKTRSFVLIPFVQPLALIALNPVTLFCNLQNKEKKIPQRLSYPRVNYSSGSITLYINLIMVYISNKQFRQQIDCRPDYSNVSGNLYQRICYPFIILSKTLNQLSMQR